MLNAPADAGCPNGFSREFELLAASCSPKRSNSLRTLASSADWELALEAAEHHRMIPALFAAFAAQPRISINPGLREVVRLHAWRSLQFTAELKRVGSHFDHHAIPFLAHKGPVLSHLLYGDVTARQFGDLDLLVKSRDVAQARTALLELGYRSKPQLAPRHEKAYVYSCYEYAFCLDSDRPTVELQWRIVPRFFSINFDMDAIFDRSIELEVDGQIFRTMRQEDLMLALCVHAAKHEWCQLGMVRDIVRLAAFDLDWEWIGKAATRMGIVGILQFSLLIGQKIFDCDMPATANLPKWLGDSHVESKINDLVHNREPNTDSISYFLSQVRYRERLRDRARFLWRLAMTPGVSEWEAVKRPGSSSGLYQLVRMKRLAKRLFAHT